MTNARVEGPRRRGTAWGVLIVLAVILAMAAGFVALVAATHGPARSEPSGTIAVAEVEGRSVAVVVYETDTFGHLDIFRAESMGFSTQAEAFDLDTGERVWDTLLFAEFSGTEAEVLGMGSEYVYIGSAEGLLILDAATGEIIAREGEIDGLGEDYIASIDAYVWDVASGAVVLLDASGTVLSIPLDGVEAVHAPAEVAARWVDDLNTESDPGSVFPPDAWEQLDSRAPVPGSDWIDPTWATGGRGTDVLLEDGTGFAAGWQWGFAVTQTANPTSSDAYYLFQVGDLETGRLLGTVSGEADASAVTVTDAGHVVMLSTNDTHQGLLVVASTSGIRSSVIGERAFLGW